MPEIVTKNQDTCEDGRHLGEDIGILLGTVSNIVCQVLGKTLGAQ